MSRAVDVAPAKQEESCKLSNKSGVSRLEFLDAKSCALLRISEAQDTLTPRKVWCNREQILHRKTFNLEQRPRCAFSWPQDHTRLDQEGSENRCMQGPCNIYMRTLPPMCALLHMQVSRLHSFVWTQQRLKSWTKGAVIGFFNFAEPDNYMFMHRQSVISTYMLWHSRNAVPLETISRGGIRVCWDSRVAQTDREKSEIFPIFNCCTGVKTKIFDCKTNAKKFSFRFSAQAWHLVGELFSCHVWGLLSHENFKTSALKLDENLENPWFGMRARPVVPTTITQFFLVACRRNIWSRGAIVHGEVQGRNLDCFPVLSCVWQRKARRQISWNGGQGGGPIFWDLLWSMHSDSAWLCSICEPGTRTRKSWLLIAWFSHVTNQ